MHPTPWLLVISTTLVSVTTCKLCCKSNQPKTKKKRKAAALAAQQAVKATQLHLRTLCVDTQYDDIVMGLSNMSVGGNNREHRKPSWGGPTCFNCHEVGHKSDECEKPKQPKKWCGYCRSNTHTDKACRSRKPKNNDNNAHKDDHANLNRDDRRNNTTDI